MGMEKKVRRLVAIAALVASGFASAVLADTTPPELVSWTASPDIVNRLDGPIEVRVEFEFFDPSSWDLSDFKVLGLREEPQGPNSSSSSLRYGYSYTRGGDSMDGFAVFTIQPDVPRGTYYVFFEGLSDSAGNYFRTPESDPPYKEGPVFDVCDSNFESACVTTDTSSGDDPAVQNDDASGSAGGTSNSVFRVSLEEPVEGQTHMGVGNLRGWAVADSGIDKVEIFIDGSYAFDIPYGGYRGDVGGTFPDVADSEQSGFSAAFNYSDLSSGSHTVTAVAYSASGATEQSSASFNVVRFASEFISDPNAVRLNDAVCRVSGDEISLVDAVVSGEIYDLLLKWRTAEQGFEIIEIR